MTYPIIEQEKNGAPKTMIGDSDSIVLTPTNPMVDVGLLGDPLARPFFPYRFYRAGENDLTRIAPDRPLADGEIITVTGKITDDDGRPVSGTCVELWNANKHGRYTHVHCPEASGPIDPNFHGCGRIITDDQGVYSFKTIRPGAYLAEAEIDWWRPPHLHFSIYGGGTRLITQMLFPGDELIKKDLIWLFVSDEKRRAKMIAEQGADKSDYRFDMVLRGPQQTPMEADDHDH